MLTLHSHDGLVLNIMKIMNQIIAIVLFLGLSSSQAEEEIRSYQGFLVLAPEVDTFTPCGSKEPLWLDLPKGAWEPLAKQYKKLAKKPYEGTYAVLIGKTGPKLDCGFCENYTGSFKVIKIVEHRIAKSTDCKMSNEPLEEMQ